MRFNGNFFRLASRLCILIIAVSVITQCAAKRVSELPKDIFGVSVGMSKTDAESRLKEAAKLIRLDRKRQEVWALKPDARFSHLAVGYDKEDRIRYITAFAKPKDATPFAPSEIGNLADAKQDMTEPNYRYTWQVAARDGKPAYDVIAQGSKPESIAQYSLSALADENSAEEEAEEEENERK